MITSRLALALLCALLLSSASALGQPTKAIPRLLDGKPDMRGYWTNQTFTPLERPAQFKDKAVFTAEEADLCERCVEKLRALRFLRARIMRP